MTTEERLAIAESALKAIAGADMSYGILPAMFGPPSFEARLGRCIGVAQSYFEMTKAMKALEPAAQMSMETTK